MAVLINSSPKIPDTFQTTVKKQAQAILNVLECPDVELSILITDDREMAELNRTYLRREGPTNVIAFPMHEGDCAEVSPFLLGDVAISVDTAAREGREAGLSMEDRFTELLVHGILHLLGFDHEASDVEAIRMDEKSREILSMMRFSHD